MVQYVEIACIIDAIERGRVRTKTVDFVWGISEFNAESIIANIESVTNTDAIPMIQEYMPLFGVCLYKIEMNKYWEMSPR